MTSQKSMTSQIGQADNDANWNLVIDELEKKMNE
jgi:hypothetical protein